MRHLVTRFAIFITLTLAFEFPAHAQEAEWTRLNQEVATLSSQKNYSQAGIVAEQALNVAEKTFGPNHQNVAASLNLLAVQFHSQGKYAQAEPLYKRSLAIYEKTLGPDHPNVAVILTSLYNVYLLQEKYGDAEFPLKRSLALKEKIFGPDHPNVAADLTALAGLYRGQGLVLTQIEPLYKRALAINEKALGHEHPTVAKNLNNLASAYYIQGQFALAEPLLKRVLTINEKTFGPEHPEVAVILGNLADVYRNQGKYAEAESLLKRALAIDTKVFGPDHSTVNADLNGLGDLYYVQGQLAKAEPIFQRLLAISEKLGPDHPAVAAPLSRLASLYGMQGQYAKAEPLLQRALAISEKSYGPDHPVVAHVLNSLAINYFMQRKFALAEPLYKRVSAINEKAFGSNNPRFAADLDNLAELYRAQGKFAEAESLKQRSLAIEEKNLGPDHPNVANDLNGLAELFIHEGKYAQALPLARRASAIMRQRIVSGGDGNAAVGEASQNRNGFLRHLLLLTLDPLKEAADKIANESLQIAQLKQASGTASAIAKMAARFASSDEALASLIKRKQDAGDRLSLSEAQLISAASSPPNARNMAAEQAMREDIVKLGKFIASIDAELTLRFPDYQELTRPEPVSVSRIQALLKPDEAMLVYALDERDIYGYLWIVRKDGAQFLRQDVDVKALANNVATVRAEMDFDGANNPIPVNLGILHQIYKSLFAPALPYLDGIKHVMIVPAGPMQSLPFGMLVASPPSTTIQNAADYRQVDWLIKHYALSVLPSVSSIQAFRQFAKTPGVQEPFAGFGDPLIGDSSGATRGVRGKRAQVDIAQVFRNLTVSASANAPARTQSTEIADVEMIRSQARLPETADELLSMAKTLHTDARSLWLRENATETQVKSMDLSKYRTLAFATHGVMAGQVQGAGEPGLILTPPKVGTPEDDGYLASSEIAKLKLNADWVLLSACNTAAADGTPGAEGLSGLAKAFFYAGARSLLVSHWPVVSEATVPLNAGMLTEYEAHPELGKAEAQRKAILKLIDSPNHPEYAHPLFWAPFVVVGEGGAASRL